MDVIASNWMIWTNVRREEPLCGAISSTAVESWGTCTIGLLLLCSWCLAGISLPAPLIFSWWQTSMSMTDLYAWILRCKSVGIWSTDSKESLWKERILNFWRSRSVCLDLFGPWLALILFELGNTWKYDLQGIGIGNRLLSLSHFVQVRKYLSRERTRTLCRYVLTG